MSDIPEADALEQAEEVDPDLDTAVTAGRATSDPEVPEADALEQAEEVPDLDER